MTRDDPHHRPARQRTDEKSEALAALASRDTAEVNAELRTRTVLARLRPDVDAATAERARRTVEHLRGDR